MYLLVYIACHWHCDKLLMMLQDSRNQDFQANSILLNVRVSRQLQDTRYSIIIYQIGKQTNSYLALCHSKLYKIDKETSSIIKTKEIVQDQQKVSTPDHKEI